MGAIQTAADTAFRDYVTDGVPSSGAFNIDKSVIRDLFGTVEEEVEKAGLTIPSAASYGITGSGDETTAFTTALAAETFLFLPPGNYTTTGLTETQLQKIWGFGTLTNDGDIEISKFTIPQGLFIPMGERDGTSDDIINLPTVGVPLEIHNRKNATNNALDIFNKGNFAAGTSAASAIVVHHYTDSVAVQIDNVGINANLILKAGRNDAKRPDKGANWVAEGGFLSFTRSGYDGEGGGQNITTFTRAGGIKFEDDPLLTDYRTIEGVGAQKIKIKAAGGILWLEGGAFDAEASVLGHVLAASPIRLSQINGGSGYTAAQTAFMLYRQGSDIYWSTGSVATKLN